MIEIAVAMLIHKKSRMIIAVIGIGFSFFLVAAQIGLLVGWCNTTSALIRHADADVWVMAPQTPAYDYGTPIPRNHLYETRSVRGVQCAQSLFVAWNILQRTDGRRISVELVGLDDALDGGPWEFSVGRSDCILRPDTLIVDDLYLQTLGIKRIGDDVEMIGGRAHVGGISHSVRTFTASPFVFTSIATAIKWDRRYRDDEITYILVNCARNQTPEVVRDNITKSVSGVEALTSHDFIIRTISYWMLDTGAGITVVVTALLGLVVGIVIISQTLFAITQDHLPNYGTLLALGFSRRKMAGIVALQSALLGVGGITVGSIFFEYAAAESLKTPIPIETTQQIFYAMATVCLACCMLASFMSIQSIFRLDPAVVFKG